MSRAFFKNANDIAIKMQSNAINKADAQFDGAGPLIIEIICSFVILSE